MGIYTPALGKEGNGWVTEFCICTGPPLLHSSTYQGEGQRPQNPKAFPSPVLTKVQGHLNKASFQTLQEPTREPARHFPAFAASLLPLSVPFSTVDRFTSRDKWETLGGETPTNFDPVPLGIG